MDKLAKDMIQCKADGYGVHSGAWKAAQEEKERRAKLPEPPKKKEPEPPAAPQGRPRCVICGKEIPKRSHRSKTCSPECARTRRYQQNRDYKNR